MAVAALYLYKTPKTYLIMSNVLISDEKTSGSTGSSAAILKNLTGGLGGSKVDDEVIVINSHEIRHDVVKELKLNRTYFERKNFLKKINLYNTAPIAIDAPAEVFDTISKNLQFKLHIKNDGKVDIKVKTGFFETLADLKGLTLPATVKTEYGIFIINKTEFFKKGKDGRYIAYVSNNDASAEKLLKSMLVKLVSKKANVIYLRVSDTNKKRGKDILNTLEQIYNDRNQQEKDDNALSTAKFIDERLAIIYKDLAQSEINIEEFKRKNNIIDVEQQAKAIIAKQGTADKHAIALETRYRIVTMIQDFVKNPENKYAYIPFSADSTSASGSISAYNGLILKRMKLEGSALPNNQALQELDAQIDHMRANVQHGIANTLSALQVQIERARSVSNSSLDQMSNMPSQERISRDLYREQGIQNALYTFLLQKREENALTLAVTSPKGKVIDKPYAQTKPDAPNVSIVLGFALLMSIILPIIFLYLRNLLNTKFNSQEELGELTKSPILGEICHSKSGHELVVTPSKTSSVVELFKLVRNNIQFMLTNDNDKVILVTSSVSGEGKSFVSTNLAASYALLGKKVALVGMDIRSPKLADILRLKEIPGVTSYLSQKSVTVADIAQPCDQVSGLDVFVGGVIPPNPSELLISDRTQEFISQLRELYDIIVLDTAPIAMVSDTFAISKLADITIFVARANHTGKNFIKFFNDAVERGQLGKTAVILNDTNPRLSQGYGYGYGRGLDSDE
ncbi:MAG: polysaccharide biosynthesis tyrosine autokinase [Muribaculaceae bacterium]|nr:polysaccharide biosynthesis tyrosine autokinase [Muribaculaceae bacterium]